MSRKRVALGVLLAGSVVLQLQACTTRECSTGTVDKNGKCTAENVGGIECGAGTHLDQGTLQCVPDQYVCDPDTTNVTDGGVCVGRASGSLPTPPSCPSVAADEICVSGWLRDFDNQGQAPFSKDTLITDDSVEIWVFDPFKVLLCTTPPCFDTSQAIAGPFYANADGTFILDKDTTDRPIKATGTYLALGVQSKGVADPTTDGVWAQAGITCDGQGGLTIEKFDLYAVPRTQTAAWDAASPGIIDKGAFVMMFHYLNTDEADPAKSRTFIKDVLPNNSPGAIDITRLYFFTTDRNTIVQGAADGVNLTSDIGGAMLAPESLGPHSASGGVVPGSDPAEPITWESRLGASVPGLVFLQFFNQQLQ